MPDSHDDQSLNPLEQYILHHLNMEGFGEEPALDDTQPDLLRRASGIPRFPFPVFHDPRWQRGIHINTRLIKLYQVPELLPTPYLTIPSTPQTRCLRYIPEVTPGWAAVRLDEPPDVIGYVPSGEVQPLRSEQAVPPDVMASWVNRHSDRLSSAFRPTRQEIRRRSWLYRSWNDLWLGVIVIITLLILLSYNLGLPASDESAREIQALEATIQAQQAQIDRLETAITNLSPWSR